jgi:hypothetical protein
MARKSKKQDAPPELKTVDYEKTGPDGGSESDYLPTSGKEVRVYSKWQHDLRYETAYGIVEIKGLASSPVVAPYATSAIPVECWNWIVGIYGKTNMFRNHFVYATETDDAGYGDGKARELAAEQTGLEKLEAGKIATGVRQLKPS